MGNTPQSSQCKTPQSGSSELPSILAYPEVLGYDDVPEIKGQFVYIIEDYPDQGLAVMIKRDEGTVHLGIGDWEGATIDFEKATHPLYPAAHLFATEHAPEFIEMMRLLAIQQMMVYIAVEEDDWQLTDLRVSLDKFYGPGMVRDLFGKIFPTQVVRKIVSLNEDTIAALEEGKGSYQGDLILKCSKFKTISREKRLLPLYARVSR